MDLTHLDKGFVFPRLGAILDIYRKFSGADPLEQPMDIFPAAHYAMGGLWIDFEKDETGSGIKADSPRNHATNIPGLFACGECDYGYHGANRLGANSLLSASYSGRVAGESVNAYLKGLGQDKHHLSLGESSAWSNQSLSQARDIFDMVKLAQVITRSARTRDECRGAHYKPQFKLPIPAGKFAGDPEFETYRAKWKANTTFHSGTFSRGGAIKSYHSKGGDRSMPTPYPSNP